MGKINYQWKTDDWNMFEKNNPKITLNTMYTKKKILPDYMSNHNSNRERTIILLMIRNKEKERWHYLVVKKLSTLLRGKTSKHHGDFQCLSCLHSFQAKSMLKSHEKVCKNKDFVER